MDLGAPILDVELQTAGDITPETIVKDGQVTYQKIDGLTKSEWIAKIELSDAKDFLCKHMLVKLAFKSLSSQAQASFSDCKLHGSDFDSITL